MGENQNFTIMTITGNTDEAVKAGVGLQELPLSIPEMVDFAKANNLLMDIVDLSPEGETIEAVDAVTALDILSTGPFDNGTESTPYNTKVGVEGGNGALVEEVTDGALPVGSVRDRHTGTIHGRSDT